MAGHGEGSYGTPRQWAAGSIPGLWIPGLAGVVGVRFGRARSGPAWWGRARSGTVRAPMVQFSEGGIMSGMKAANPTITAAVGRCFEFAAELQRGDLFTYHDLERLSGFKKDGPHWGSFKRRLRARILNELKTDTWFQPNAGLLMLKKDDQLKFIPRHRRKKMRTQCNKTRASVAALPDKELTATQRQLKSLELEETRRVRCQALAADRAVKALRAGGGSKQPRYVPDA